MRASIGLADVQDEVAEEVTQAHAQLEATATQVDQAANSVKEATITFDGTLRGLGETRGGGELLILVSRPQEAVAALQQLSRAYDNYYAAVNGYNRAQFQLFWALGCPARTLICDHPLGEVDPLDVPPRNANQGG
jgi:outer membrane protein TolC